MALLKLVWDLDTLYEAGTGTMDKGLGTKKGFKQNLAIFSTI
jgi:hypothetical protein